MLYGSWFFQGTYILRMPDFQLFAILFSRMAFPNGIYSVLFFIFAYFFEYFNFTNLPISAEFNYLEKTNYTVKNQEW